MARPTSALIVDDEPHVRVFLRLLLQELGIQKIWEAKDGTEALALTAQHRPELVLLDMNLPVLNGLEVLTQLAAAQPELPVIVVSSQNAMKTVLECRKLGAIAYVLKHASKNEALSMLGAALDGLEDEEQPNS